MQDSVTAVAQDLLKIAHDTIAELAHMNAQQEKELLSLRQAKEASGEKVILEKVASIDADKAQQFACFLSDAGLIEEKHIEKFAASIAADPNSVFAVAAKAIKISIPLEPQGHGINKTASSTKVKDGPVAVNQEYWDKLKNQ